MDYFQISEHSPLGDSKEAFHTSRKQSRLNSCIYFYSLLNNTRLNNRKGIFFSLEGTAPRGWGEWEETAAIKFRDLGNPKNEILGSAVGKAESAYFIKQNPHPHSPRPKNWQHCLLDCRQPYFPLLGRKQRHNTFILFGEKRWNPLNTKMPLQRKIQRKKEFLDIKIVILKI